MVDCGVATSDAGDGLVGKMEGQCCENVEEGNTSLVAVANMMVVWTSWRQRLEANCSALEASAGSQAASNAGCRESMKVLLSQMHWKSGM